MNLNLTFYLVEKLNNCSYSHTCHIATSPGRQEIRLGGIASMLNEKDD